MNNDKLNPQFNFFFQAEDGIRDRNVTGVQTCALPIWNMPSCAIKCSVSQDPGTRAGISLTARSEERRVGKECRSGRAVYRRSVMNIEVRRVRRMMVKLLLTMS